MLPPREVPDNLEYQDYVRLMLRYQTLLWHRQMARASKYMVDKRPPDDTMTEEGKKRAKVMMTALEGVVFVRDFGQDITSTAGILVNATAIKASEVIDQVEPLKKVRTGLLSAFTVLNDTIQDSVNTTVENFVLPAFGLPVDGVPEGRTAQEYLEMALKYEKINLPEPTREALRKARDTATANDIKKLARIRLKTRVPKIVIDQATHTKLLHAARHNLLQETGRAKELYEEIFIEEPEFEWPYSFVAMIELTDGNLERTKQLLKKGLKLNPDSLKLVAGFARVNIAEWKLAQFEKNIERLEELEPGNEMVAAFKDMLEFCKKGGLYS